MIFLLTVIFGGIIAVVVRRKNFFSMWALLFNVLIAIYISVMLSPTIIGRIPEIYGDGYCYGLCLLALALPVFLISQSLASIYLTRDFNVSFPKVFNGIGSSLFGFLVGYFGLNFIIFAIGIMPLSEYPFVKQISGDVPLVQIVRGPVLTTCNTVRKLSLQWDVNGCEPVVAWLTAKEEKTLEKDSPLPPEEKPAAMPTLIPKLNEDM